MPCTFLTRRVSDAKLVALTILACSNILTDRLSQNNLSLQSSLGNLRFQQLYNSQTYKIFHHWISIEARYISNTQPKNVHAWIPTTVRVNGSREAPQAMVTRVKPFVVRAGLFNVHGMVHYSIIWAVGHMSCEWYGVGYSIYKTAQQFWPYRAGHLLLQDHMWFLGSRIQIPFYSVISDVQVI